MNGTQTQMLALNPNGQPFFSSLRKQTAMGHLQSEALDSAPSLNGQPPPQTATSKEPLQQNLDRLVDIYGSCQQLLGDYDRKLIKVVEKHEHDFLNAYKTHMSKVERELISLKAKAADQEQRLAKDERILKLQEGLGWFKDEVDRLTKMREDNFNSIDMLSTKVQTMLAEKRFMEEQVKASKRQNKLLVMALTKQEATQANIEGEITDLEHRHLEARKKQVIMPSTEVSPFADPKSLSFIMSGAGEAAGVANEYNRKATNPDDPEKHQRMNTNIENSLMVASTDFPSELVTSRVQRLSPQNLDLVASTQQPNQADTVIQQYTMDLVTSGRDDAEIVDSLEQYYSSLAHGFDDELMRVQKEIELHKAAARELEAQEIVLPASESDDLSNYFIECVFKQRKSLRHQLLTMRDHPNSKGFSSGRSQTFKEGTARKTVSNVYNNSLLNIYINTVKTGSQEEIEQFSQIEKQKLVQLLSTNNELLTFMFDKMFKNNKKPQPTTSTGNQQPPFRPTQGISSSQTLSVDQQEGNAEMQQQQQQDIFAALMNMEQQQQAYTEESRRDFPQVAPQFGINKNSDPFFSQQTTKKLYQQNTTGEIQQNTAVKNPYKPIAEGTEGGGYYLSASPLLLGEPKKSSLNQSNILLSRIKESNFNSNILSNIDTDYLQQQYLSQEAGVTLNPQTQMTHHQPYKSTAHTARNHVGPHQQSAEKRRLRQLTTERPSMFVKNGKLLIGANKSGRGGQGPNKFSIEAEKMREHEIMLEQVLAAQRGTSGVQV
ncbi:hypothetical protein FGO68_gene15745 [Halteria grandinella]|uniref:Uncharacterized protein n=1 Tax=Halteria grandinella TaxID=5974 RepID=A0A8J8SX80_HALGN|nr:hypothetical protein FGO68_gene15745 [Halteria grandinella]